MTSTRAYESLQTLAQLLEFDTVEALKTWMAGKLCKPYWEEYTLGREGLKKLGSESPKLHDFEQVLRHLTEGESGGNRKFSEDSPDISLWRAIDWQARLMWKLCSVNKADRNGPLYGKNLDSLEPSSRMWQVILRLTQEKSRPRKRKATEISRDFEDWKNENKSTLAILKNMAARVIWSDIPKNIELQGISPMITLPDLSIYTYESLLKAVDIGFELTKHNFQVSRLSISDNYLSPDSYTRALQYAAKSKENLMFMLTTAQVVPESIIPTLEDETTPRQMLYELMVAERLSTNPNFKERFWIWDFLQQVSDSQELPLDSACEIVHEAPDAAEDCIQWLIESKDSEVHDDEGARDSVFREITNQEIQNYRKQEKWIDNPDLQRQGHGEACTFLGIPNKDIPRLPGMPISTKFEFWQPLAIKALSEFEDGFFRGGILADEVGIGKTFEAIGLEQFKWNQRKAAIKAGVKVAPPQPTLIVVPPNLIQQWSSTIKQMSEDLIVKIYYGGKQKETANGIEYLGGTLSRQNDVFAATEETARTVIITSFRTLNSRHGPNSFAKWMHSNIPDKTKLQEFKDSIKKPRWMENIDPTTEWEFRLAGLFKRLIIDEAHEIRNMKISTAITLRWIQAPAVLLLTATPLWNGLADIVGLLHQLEPQENPWSEESLKKVGAFDIVPWPASDIPTESSDSNEIEDGRDSAAEALEEYMQKFNPWDVSPDHPAYALRYTSLSVKQHLLKGEMVSTEAGWRMRDVLKACMIKRSYGSLVDGQVVGKALPAVQNISVHLKFTGEERMIYDQVLGDCKRPRQRGKKNQDKARDLFTSSFRRLTLVTSWVDFEYMLEYKVEKLKQFRKNGATAYKFLKIVSTEKKQKRKSKRGRKNSSLEPEIPNYPLPSSNNTHEIILSHCRGSPKLRYLLQLVAELVVLRKEKLLIFVSTPLQIQWLESVLKLLALDVHSYRAELSLYDRHTLAEVFHQSSNRCQILITSFWVCSAGLNLHGYCRNLVFWDSASVSVEQQALGRLKRVGASKTIRVFRLFIEDTFSTEQNLRHIRNALPALMAQLNMEIFGDKSSPSQVPMNRWVCHNGELFKANDPSVASLNLPVLDVDELLAKVLFTQQGNEVASW